MGRVNVHFSKEDYQVFVTTALITVVSMMKPGKIQ